MGIKKAGGGGSQGRGGGELALSFQRSGQAILGYRSRCLGRGRRPGQDGWELYWGGRGRGCEAGKGRGCPKGHDERAKVVLGALGGALAGVGLSRAVMRSDWSQGAMVGAWARMVALQEVSSGWIQDTFL